eukprot:613358-Prymnesium_polylepis.1
MAPAVTQAPSSSSAARTSSLSRSSTPTSHLRSSSTQTASRSTRRDPSTAPAHAPASRRCVMMAPRLRWRRLSRSRAAPTVCSPPSRASAS